MSEPFNPLDVANLGLSITTAMLATEPTPIDEVGVFAGAGIYAIYYRGDQPEYKLLSEQNLDCIESPVYVGKAVPSGSRKGVAVAKSVTTRTLSARLREHKRNIVAAENLNSEDFWCRWLVVEPIWISLGARIMINR